LRVGTLWPLFLLAGALGRWNRESSELLIEICYQGFDTLQQSWSAMEGNELVSDGTMIWMVAHLCQGR
jgi:hypothetical protein